MRQLAIRMTVPTEIAFDHLRLRAQQVPDAATCVAPRSGNARVSADLQSLYYGRQVYYYGAYKRNCIWLFTAVIRTARNVSNLILNAAGKRLKGGSFEETEKHSTRWSKIV
jgi:hypothetical protein